MFSSSSIFFFFFLQRTLLRLLMMSSSPSAFPISSSFTDPSILITVKTTVANHRSRVEDALATWASSASRLREENTQILFVTDSPPQPPSPLIQPTKCPRGHTNAALCCKMAAELRMALQRSPDFWCHFDDDNFVLLANLRDFLRQFRPEFDDLYLGRASTSGPVTIPQLVDRPELLALHPRERHFWFGTGGAGLCLSASTLRKLRDFVSGTHHQQQKRQFEWLCAQLGVPDDVTLGFILESLLGIPLTRSDRLHSHLDRVDAIPRSQLADQISLSGSWPDDNLVNVPEHLRPHDGNDLLRFRSLHKFIWRRDGKEKRRRTKFNKNYKKKTNNLIST
uniref:Fringe-like glycosyltransferase domain-containing protein n=1 Tax=Globodera rostochiensis TaxID=31243 RepID=A0A914H2K7_GLORO